MKVIPSKWIFYLLMWSKFSKGSKRRQHSSVLARYSITRRLKNWTEEETRKRGKFHAFSLKDFPFKRTNPLFAKSCQNFTLYSHPSSIIHLHFFKNSKTNENTLLESSTFELESFEEESKLASSQGEVTVVVPDAFAGWMPSQINVWGRGSNGS